MDDTQTNKGNTERERENLVKAVQQSPEDRAEAFAKVRKEYEHLKDLLNERVRFQNVDRGDLPEFSMVGSEILQLGHVALSIHLEQLYQDPNIHLLKFRLGLAPSKTIMFGRGPTAEFGDMRANLLKDGQTLLWTSNQGAMTSEKLVAFIFDWLTQYYLRHKPKA